jgi:hypothetical protein
MVFFTYTLVMRPRNRHTTALALKEFSHAIYGAGGALRKLTNEGIFRPYRRFRDEKGELHQFTRFVTVQCDLSDAGHQALMKRFADHPDVLKHVFNVTEHSAHMWRSGGSDLMNLDTFVRLEEELMWPPQVSAQAFDQMDLNFKEFQRQRWSSFLRS